MSFRGARACLRCHFEGAQATRNPSDDSLLKISPFGRNDKKRRVQGAKDSEKQRVQGAKDSRGQVKKDR